MTLTQKLSAANQELINAKKEIQFLKLSKSLVDKPQDKVGESET